MWIRRGRATTVVPAPAIIGDFSDGRIKPVRGIRLLAVFSVVIILSASASVFALSTRPTQPTITVTATDITYANVTPAVKTSAQVAARHAKKPVSSRAVTPSCTAGTDSRPSALALSDSSNGVVTRTDSSHTYRVYGSTPTTIWSQIKRCSPVRDDGVFAANTSYQLNYLYRYAAGSDGLCRIVSAAVSMHVSQVFPVWSPASGTPGSTTTAWNQFIAGLRTHEKGHVAIDKTYANKIYEAMLAAQPASSCADLRANVDASVRKLQSQLNAANDAYDSRTGHGRTQGAAL